MSPNSDHAKPLAIPASDEEDGVANHHPRRASRRRCCLAYCGVCAGLTVVIAVVIVILVLTVFKVKDPKMTLNTFTIDRLSLNAGPPTTINMTVVADVSVKNPNAASFQFGATATSLYYKEALVGVAYGPPGEAKAMRTFRTNVTVEVMADRVVKEPGLVGDLIGSSSVEMKSETMVGGRVKVLGLFKHHVDVMMNCTITVSVANQSIMDQSCVQRVWL